MYPFLKLLGNLFNIWLSYQFKSNLQKTSWTSPNFMNFQGQFITLYALTAALVVSTVIILGSNLGSTFMQKLHWLCILQ